VRAVLTLLFLTVMLHSSSALAQNESAESLLRQGVAQRHDGDDAAALRSFERAYALTPSGNALGQMGLAEQALTHWRSADEHLRAALATQDPWVERNRPALQEAYEVVRGRVAHDAAEIPRVASVHSTEPARSPPTSPAPVQRQGVPTLRVAGYIAAGTAGLTLAGTVIALAIRESTVLSYNSRCRGLGDPLPASGCDETGPVATANTAGTAAIATGIIGGALGVGAIVALLITPHDDAHEHAFVCAPNVLAPGIACNVRF